MCAACYNLWRRLLPENEGMKKREYWADPERARQYQREYYVRNPLVRIQKRDYFRGVRQEMVEAYGGECECCGETEPKFLTIDHIFRDGKEDRRINGFGTKFYRHLREQGWPRDRYRLFCMNCNFATRLGDPCPHTLTREAVA
jgi:hypothetical protein